MQDRLSGIFPGIRTEAQQADKIQGGSYLGMRIDTGNGMAAPVFNLEPVYEEAQRTGFFDGILKNLEEKITEVLRDMPQIGLEDLSSYDQAKDSNGTAVSFTTDASGNTTAVSISAGTYYVKETKAPENFKMDETVYPVTAESSSEAVVIIRDTPVIYGGVKVKKADTQGSTAQGDASLAGAEFTIYNASGTAVKVITTGSNGVASTEETDLTEGSYTVQEKGL